MSEVIEEKVNISPVVDFYKTFTRESVAQGPGACVIYQLKDRVFNLNKDVHAVDLTYCDKSLENLTLMNDLVKFVGEIPEKYKLKQDEIHSRVKLMTYMNDNFRKEQVSTLLFTTGLREKYREGPYRGNSEGFYLMDRIIFDVLKAGYKSGHTPLNILSNYNFSNCLEPDNDKRLFITQDEKLEYIIEVLSSSIESNNS